MGRRGPRSAVCDLRGHLWMVLPRERDWWSSERLQSNQEAWFALKSPSIMVFWLMGWRRKESIGDSGSVYTPVTVHPSTRLMVTLSLVHEKFSMRSMILFAIYTQTRGGGELTGGSANNR